ncbi:MAG: GGDEF domain-containing protein [Candidatus Aenigmarchaeota archaeon]|nr:GGDEF domain-containing protein [Candidatus Aenigmarchaeota archaeon]
MKKYYPLRDPAVVRLMNENPDFARYHMRVRKQARNARMYKREARTDSVTGLGNKRGYDEQLEREFSRSKRHKYPLTLGFGDIRGFEEINNMSSHGEGDRVLNCIARRLEEAVREEDYVARVYGDEFGLICVDASSSSAKSLIRRIIQHTCKVKVKDGAEIEMPISMRFALVTYPDVPAKTWENLHETADKALTNVRDKGCSIYVVSKELFIP